MQKNGVHNNSVKLIYKIAANSFIIVILSSIINIVFNIVTNTDRLFITSFIPLLAPDFNFSVTHSYFEIIPFIIILSFSIVFCILNKRDYYNTKLKRSYFIPITTLFYMHNSAWATAVYVDIGSINESDLMLNMLFSALYSIFLIIAFLIKQSECQKDLDYSDDDAYHWRCESFKNIKQLFNSILGIEAGVVLFSLFMRYIDTNGNIFNIAIPILYFFMGISPVIVFIVLILDYRRLIKLQKDTPPEKHYLAKLNILQIISFVLFVLSYFVIMQWV